MALSKVTIVIAFCSALGFASPLAYAQKIYWTSNGIGDHKIMRSDLDGTNIEEFLTGIQPVALTVDPVNGKLYWTGHIDVGPGVRIGPRIGAGTCVSTQRTFTAGRSPASRKPDRGETGPTSKESPSGPLDSSELHHRPDQSYSAGGSPS